MKNLLKKTEIYLHELEDTWLDFKPKPESALPLILRERYLLYSTNLFGSPWLLALEADGWDPGSPTEYRHHWQQLQRVAAEDHVALVLPSISATVRNRMIRMQVPFIVPSTQMFLPLSIISLKESFGNARPIEGKPLPPAAQVLLLIQLQEGGLQDLSSKEISKRLGYSRASISTACSELEQNQLCQTFRKGKELRIDFSRPPGELWAAALPLLRSPVRKVHSVKWEFPVPEVKFAGISALSRRSNLAEDEIPTFAMPEQSIRRGLEDGRFNGCPDRHVADAHLEAWSYGPALLTDGPSVDPLSLFLSLRDNPDERVQSELSTMVEDLPWQ